MFENHHHIPVGESCILLSGNPGAALYWEPTKLTVAVEGRPLIIFVFHSTDMKQALHVVATFSRTTNEVMAERGVVFGFAREHTSQDFEVAWEAAKAVNRHVAI